MFQISMLLWTSWNVHDIADIADIMQIYISNPADNRVRHIYRNLWTLVSNELKN